MPPCPSFPMLPAMLHITSALKKLLLQKSVHTGTFTLASGKESDLYIDCRMTALDPFGALLIGDLGWHAVRSKIHSEHLKIDAIGGMTLGADPISLAVGMTSAQRHPEEALQVFTVRKEPKGHGAGKQIELATGLNSGYFPALALSATVSTTLLPALGLPCWVMTRSRSAQALPTSAIGATARASSRGICPGQIAQSASRAATALPASHLAGRVRRLLKSCTGSMRPTSATASWTTAWSNSREPWS